MKDPRIVEADHVFTLALTAQAIQTMTTAVADLPYRVAQPIMDQINMQLDAQLAPPAEEMRLEPSGSEQQKSRRKPRPRDDGA